MEDLLFDIVEGLNKAREANKRVVRIALHPDDYVELVNLLATRANKHLEKREGPEDPAQLHIDGVPCVAVAKDVPKGKCLYAVATFRKLSIN